jgi:hypothetical protein
MIGEGDCEEIGGMKIGGGNRSTRRKPTPAPNFDLTVVSPEHHHKEVTNLMA